MKMSNTVVRWYWVRVGCPTGHVLTGGGCFAHTGSPDAGIIASNYESPNADQPQAQWACRYNRATSGFIYAQAVCCKS